MHGSPPGRALRTPRARPANSGGGWSCIKLGSSRQRSTPPGPAMAAAQTLLLWAAASLAAAAPQLDFGAPSPVAVGQLAGNSLDQGQIVTEVVATLQPSIAAAVAEALAGLRSSAAAVEREAFEQELAADPAINTLAEYNYEYKVADNDAQTYISKQESRDGDSLTGSYSYVNPAGTLVTVNYEASADQTLIVNYCSIALRRGRWDIPRQLRNRQVS